MENAGGERDAENGSRSAEEVRDTGWRRDSVSERPQRCEREKSALEAAMSLGSTALINATRAGEKSRVSTGDFAVFADIRVAALQNTY